MYSLIERSVDSFEGCQNNDMKYLTLIPFIFVTIKRLIIAISYVNLKFITSLILMYLFIIFFVS